MFDLFEVLLTISPFAVIYLLWFSWKMNKRLGRLESMMTREHLSRLPDIPKPDSALATPAQAQDIEPGSTPWTGIATPPASTAPPGSSMPPEIPTRPFGPPENESANNAANDAANDDVKGIAGRPAKGITGISAKGSAPIAASVESKTRDQSLTSSPNHKSPSDSSPGHSSESFPESFPGPSPESSPEPFLESTLDSIGRAFKWAARNWFHTTAAISLALAGIFITRYAADLIAPETRIAIALGLGAVLIVAGEYLRRKFGDEPNRATAYLPSIFSGTGLITLFGAVLASKTLYGLIGANAALGGLALVATLAVLLGWVYGPVLAVAGILGATAAPFLVGGPLVYPSELHVYFGMIAITGLLIHAMRHWRGFDILSIIVPVAAALFVLFNSGGEIVFMGLMFVLSIACPFFTNATLVRNLSERGGLVGLARLYLLTWYATVLLIPVCVSLGNSLDALLVGTVFLALMFLFVVCWQNRTGPVIEMAMSAAVGLALLAGPVLPDLIIELQGNNRVVALIGIICAAIFMSLVSAFQSTLEEDFRNRDRWALGSAIIAPGILVIFEIMLKPGDLLGVPVWAGIAMGIAVLATLFAERAARFDASDHLRPALGGLVALSMIALSLFASLQGVALSVALGVLTCAAAVLDQKYRLPPLSGFVQAGVAVLLYRSVIDPGLFQAFEMNWGPFLIMYLVPYILLHTALVTYHDMNRPITRAALGSAVAVFAALSITVIVTRMADENILFASGESHAMMGVLASAWIISAWINLFAINNVNVIKSVKTGQADGNRKRLAIPQTLRVTAVIVSLVPAFGFLLIGTTFFNPLFLPDSAVFGPLLFNSMVPAYILPGVLLLLAARHLRLISQVIRAMAAACGSCLIFGYACLTVAQAWRGANLTGTPMGEGELWTYTILLLAIGVALFVMAVKRQSRRLRILANIAIILAISKVFMVDAAELAGLVRAGSFLVLGLVLAGLAWVNRLVTVGTNSAESTGSD